ncbi:MAG: glycosyl hydrolase, partial [Bacteroidota bacterium]
RTALGRTEDRRLTPIGIPASSMVVNRKELIDLTDKLDAKGHLTTKLPAGEWTILRFGQTTTGATNHPASEEGRGLEVDKLSREAFKVHYDAFVGEVVERNKTLAPNALQYAEIDSYEMGGQNWTDGFNESFARAKGYDIMDYLPLLAGRFVDDATTSETVLRDFRGHICDLMTKNYFAYFTELCHEDGILSYVEPYGFGPLNNLEVGGTCDLPMGEFWVGREMNRVESAISSAHIYGKLVISAEAFTTRPGLNWKGHPAMAKTTGDQAWAAGINEFMFHRFAHQANTHVSPGMTMNRWGFHFDRTQTWWDNAGKDWFEYMARGQFLLRQGVPVADLAVFVGDGAPNGVYYRNDFAPALPANLNFDCINADVLLNRAKVSNGQLVLPEGTTYKLLALKNSKAMTLSTLRVLSEFSKAGLPLVGDVPERMLGFQRPEAETAEFNRLRAVLANKILPWNKWNDLLSDLQITPDAHFSGREDLTYAHRRIGDQDVYFIYNPDSLSTTLAITFRSSAYAPESWDALTGEQYRLTDFVQEKGTTRLTLNLEPKQSRFIVFRSEAPELPPLPQLAVTNQTLAIAGPWQVTFSEANGYGGEETFTELVDWSAHSNEAINYYSGTAIYRTTFTAIAPKSDERILLDLGEVNLIAEVNLNGKKVGIDWLPPFQLDVTEQLQAGENHLEISVTNLWSNRLIGEERYPEHFDGYKIDRVGNGNYTKFRMVDWYKNNHPPPAGPRTTFTTADFYNKDDALLPSGLLGPVQLLAHKVLASAPAAASTK